VENEKGTTQFYLESITSNASQASNRSHGLQYKGPGTNLLHMMLIDW